MAIFLWQSSNVVEAAISLGSDVFLFMLFLIPYPERFVTWSFE
jgi:hypothetical protein